MGGVNGHIGRGGSGEGASGALIAIADCNNFYVSCERAFNPSLEGKPVVVLSNNDGCIVSRSNEAKELGVRMAAPAYQAEPIFRKHGVHVFSSNYSLYGDMSHRVMTLLGDLVPEIEIYSIDEAFLHLPGWGNVEEALRHARAIRAAVLRGTGIPVSIGIAATKTLAKIANRYSKFIPQHQGVFALTDREDIEIILSETEVEKVWGIGRRSARRLEEKGIRSALDLRNAADAAIKGVLKINGVRTAMELRGIPCVGTDRLPVGTRESILTSRSFGRRLETLRELREAVAWFATKAVEKLRRQRCSAAYLQVFISTGSHYDETRYSGSMGRAMPQPTDDPFLVIDYAHTCLDRIYREGCRYYRAGIVLSGIVRSDDAQVGLFCAGGERRGRAMKAIDAINAEWGGGAIQSAAIGTAIRKIQNWRMKQEHRSPRYTTCWEEIPVVRAGRV